MKLFDFEKENITEAPMNPTAFAQSLEAAHGKGVLVGYEFEVCMPKATINEKPPEEPKVDDDSVLKNKVNWIIRNHNVLSSNADTEDIPPETFDDFFYIKPEKARYPTFNTAVKIVNAMVKSRTKKINQLLAEITEPIRKSAERYAKRRLRENSSLCSMCYTTELKLAYITAQYIRSPSHSQRNRASANDRVISRQISELCVIRWGKILTKYVNAPRQTVMRDFSNYFNFNPQVVLSDSWLARYYSDDQDDDEDSGTFSKVAKRLKPEVAQTMGAKVNIFRSYHESTKNLNDWYIEPDGSLEPNRGDGSAEVVSPPLPAKDAVDALKKFYALAAKLKLYTSAANHTGLHINVSIPETIDVMKLAIFSGDEYILKSFGRSDNRYAVSIMKSIMDQIKEWQHTKTNNPLSVRGKERGVHTTFGVPSQRTVLDTKILAKLAKSISGDHFASVNHTGKYVSFRHAGGDYLNDYQGILNVVGRFVRAVVIASDPEMYKQEYYQKLTKLLLSFKQSTDSSKLTYYRDVITDLKTNGTPALSISAVLLKHGANQPVDPNKFYNLLLNDRGVFREVENYYGLESGLKTAISAAQLNSAGAKDIIHSRLRSQELKDAVAELSPSECISFTLPATSTKQIMAMKRGEGIPRGVNYLDEGEEHSGLFFASVTILPPNTMENKIAVQNVIKEYIKYRQSQKPQEASGRPGWTRTPQTATPHRRPRAVGAPSSEESGPPLPWPQRDRTRNNA